MTKRTGRMVSANTHFEEWWFKTFLSNITANAAVHILKLSQFPFGSWLFLCVKSFLFTRIGKGGAIDQIDIYWNINFRM
jgi:hypothetical protein